MPQPLSLKLSAEQRQELAAVRDHAAAAYLRERAAALLKIADGQSGLSVAQHGLLKVRQHGTVYSWVRRYEAEGVQGLKIRAGRGRKAAFSPSKRG